MYDDALFYATNTTPRPQHEEHTRRQSLLDPVKLEQADGRNPTASTSPYERPPSTIISLPFPTVSRRTKSITDLYKRARRRSKEQNGTEGGDQGLSDLDINSDLDFARSYDEVSDALADATHEKYQLYLDQLSLTRRHLDSLLEDTNSNLRLLSNLTASFKAVEAQTSSFQARSQGLLDEQRRVSGIAQDVGENMQYYNLLDPLTRRLNAPGAGNLVRSQDFPQMLSNLDSCLDFMHAHPKHKEAAEYEKRYRLLMTRALTLIRVHFTNTLREISSDVSKRIGESSGNDTAMSGLLYAKFRVGASELRGLGLEVQKRAVPAVDAGPNAQPEYQSLVNELYQSYSAARGRLLTPIINRRLAEMNNAPNNQKDLITFARSTIGYIRGLCFDEYDLWHEWFEGDGGLYDFLEAICEPLYDYLRPRTIKETQLQKLCELCSLIQVRYMEEPEEDGDYVEEVPRLHFSPLIRSALEDAQTRLVFLALAALRDDIERYRPSPDDLETAGRGGRSTIAAAGPGNRAPALSGRKNSSMETPQTPNGKTPIIGEGQDSDLIDMPWAYEGGAPASEWYPTLRKAIWLLSRIYRLVNSVVFDDLAHQIVHQTTLSLLRATTALSTHTPSPTSGLPRPTLADTHLFLLKQLLILKQQIVAFDIEFVSPESDLDFTVLTSTFADVRGSGFTSLFANLANPGRLFGGIQALVPRVVENMLDAKVELDTRLRGVINEFTTAWAVRMTFVLDPSANAAPLHEQQRSLQLQMQKGRLPGPAAVAAVRTAIEREVPLLRAKLDEWLDDLRVKETLVGAVEDMALVSYEEWFARWVKEEGGAGSVGAAARKKGKGRESEVWDPETFAEWTGRVFGVRRGGIREEDGDEDEDEFEGSGVRASVVGSRVRASVAGSLRRGLGLGLGLGIGSPEMVMSP